MCKGVIDRLQMQAEIEVPDVVQLGVVVIPEPPEPVTSLGDQYVAPDSGGVLLCRLLCPRQGFGFLGGVGG